MQVFRGLRFADSFYGVRSIGSGRARFDPICQSRSHRISQNHHNVSALSLVSALGLESPVYARNRAACARACHEGTDSSASLIDNFFSSRFMAMDASAYGMALDEKLVPTIEGVVVLEKRSCARQPASNGSGQRESHGERLPRMGMVLAVGAGIRTR